MILVLGHMTLKEHMRQVEHMRLVQHNQLYSNSIIPGTGLAIDVAKGEA